MKKIIRTGLIAIIIGVAYSTPGWAISVTLGDQDFSDGSFLADAAAFNGPSAGEPAPFDSFKGSDFGADFSESWTFNFSPGSYSSATIEIGMFDVDGSTVLNQVSFFGFDGNDMNAIAFAAFNAPGVGNQLQYNVYSMTIPTAALADLADGSATFTLTLQRGRSGSSPCSDPAGCIIVTSDAADFNGAGLDFATLVALEGTVPSPVPEPSSLLLLGSGLAGLAGWRRRKTRAATS